MNFRKWLFQIIKDNCHVYEQDEIYPIIRTLFKDAGLYFSMDTFDKYDRGIMPNSRLLRQIYCLFPEEKRREERIKIDKLFTETK